VTADLEVIESFRQMNERCGSLTGRFAVRGLMRGTSHESNLVFFDDLANVTRQPAFLDPRSYRIDARRLPGEDRAVLGNAPRNGGDTGWWFLWRVELVASLPRACAGELTVHRIAFLEAYPPEQYERSTQPEK